MERCLRIGVVYLKVITNYYNQLGPGCSVGIATGYGLDGPGIESQGRRDFWHLPRSVLGPTQLPVQRIPGLSQGWKAAGE
jgi:hypothetical protein